MGDASLSESPEEEEDNDSPGPDRGDCSPQSRSRSPSTDNWLASPRKRTQTLPTFNCPLTGMAAKADALGRWSRIQESVEEKSGTLSEDIFKILDLRSSGSLFSGSQITTKEGEDRLTAQRGSDNTGSSTACSQKPSSDSQPAPVPSLQRRVRNLTASGSDQPANSRAEQKKDSQQLVDRWEIPVTTSHHLLHFKLIVSMQLQL